MYSLGLVLYDLVYPMKTLMEKQKSFESLKKGNIPKIINEKLPLVGKLLTSLVNNDPCSRPKAKEIVFLLTEYIAQTEKQIEAKLVSPAKKRKRFLSEEIGKIRPKKLLMKFEENFSQTLWKIM